MAGTCTLSSPVTQAFSPNRAGSGSCADARGAQSRGNSELRDCHPQETVAPRLRRYCGVGVVAAVLGAAPSMMCGLQSSLPHEHNHNANPPRQGLPCPI